MDIQPISNGNKTIIYICFYLSKEEGTRLNAIKQTLRESMEKNQNNFDEIRALTHAYASTWEGSVQVGEFFLE